MAFKYCDQGFKIRTKSTNVATFFAIQEPPHLHQGVVMVRFKITHITAYCKHIKSLMQLLWIVVGHFHHILLQNNQRLMDKILEKFHSITFIIMGDKSFFIKITSVLVAFDLVQYDFEYELKR